VVLFDQAVKTWQQDGPTRWSGIGFVFSAADPFFGIDWTIVSTLTEG